MLREPRHRLATASFLLVAAVCCAAAVAAARDGDALPPAPGADRLETGEQIYRAACAACHGADGRGVPRARLGFDVAPPDFTDCSFATREATGDWLAVAHQGGPVRGFSRSMPAFGEALTIAQLEAAIAHIRSFCTDEAWPRGELNLPRPLVTTKAFPEDELVIETSVDTEDPGTVRVEGVAEKRIGARSQVEVAVPVAWKEEDGGDWRSVLGDVTVGFKRVLHASLGRGIILSGNVEVALPTGDEETGTSRGTAFFEPSLLVGQLLPAGFFLQAQAGMGVPADDDEAQEEAFWRLVTGRMIQQGRWGRRWTPMLEILGSHTFDPSLEQQTHWDAVPQLQVTLSRRQHVRLGVGARVPLDDRDARETQVAAYLLWDWYDGAFFEGWGW